MFLESALTIIIKHKIKSGEKSRELATFLRGILWGVFSELPVVLKEMRVFKQ
jgi:hypothetical protein